MEQAPGLVVLGDTDDRIPTLNTRQMDSFYLK